MFPRWNQSWLCASLLVSIGEQSLAGTLGNALEKIAMHAEEKRREATIERPLLTSAS